MSITTTECHYAHCDQCKEGFGYDDMTMHYAEREALEKALAEHDWIVADGRVLCVECISANSCTLVGHRFDDWSPIDVPRYRGRSRRCEFCGDAEYDPPLQSASSAD